MDKKEVKNQKEKLGDKKRGMKIWTIRIILLITVILARALSDNERISLQNCDGYSWLVNYEGGGFHEKN